MTDGDRNEAASRPELRGAIGGFGFFALAFGTMIGVGWITALGSWFVQAGPVGAMLAFVAGGALMLVIGLCYAEVTPMLPVAGGEVAYAYKAHGTPQAFVIGWALAFGYLSVSAFEAVSVGLVLSFLFPRDRHHAAVRGGGLDRVCLPPGPGPGIHGRDHRDQLPRSCGRVQGSGRAHRAVSGLCGAVHQRGDHGWRRGEPGAPLRRLILGSGGLWRESLAVFVTVPFWFVGFDTIPQAAEERRRGSPLGRLGLYVVLAIVGSTAFYIAVILGAGMAGPWRDIVDADLPTAEAFAAAFRIGRDGPPGVGRRTHRTC